VKNTVQFLDTETITAAQWRAFFACLTNGYSISAACRKAKVSRATVYRYKNSDQFIAARWAEALEAGNDFYEDAARKRAVDGVVRYKGIYDRDGNLVATEKETKYSDGLLLAILGARMPDRYGRGITEQARQLATAELNKVIDHLAQRLAPDVFTLVLEALASDTIDVNATDSQRALASPTTIDEDQP
jgi:hypothetical protein